MDILKDLPNGLYRLKKQCSWPSRPPLNKLFRVKWVYPVHRRTKIMTSFNPLPKKLVLENAIKETVYLRYASLAVHSNIIVQLQNF